MTITGSTEPHRHSLLMRDCGTGCTTHTASSTLSGRMANVKPIAPWVGVEVDVRELRINIVDQFTSGYNSSQSAALLVGVCSSSEAEAGASARL